MEFHEKLQKLRKQKGLTQEELAGVLFVSRAAVSKWESGRGYPNIDSLKDMAKYFSVTIDELLSGEEALTMAEEDHRQKEIHFRDLVFGLLDCSCAMLLILPLFGQQVGETVSEVSLLMLTGIASYMKIVYLAMVFGAVTIGLLQILLRNVAAAGSSKYKSAVSVGWNAAGVFLFIISPQPYAAAFLFVFLTIKVLMLVKSR